MIARVWRGWVNTSRAAEYVQYINATGMAESVSHFDVVSGGFPSRDPGS